MKYIQKYQKKIRKIVGVRDSIMYKTSGQVPTKNQYYNGIQMLWTTRFGVIDTKQ